MVTDATTLDNLSHNDALRAAVLAVLEGVNDPEIRRPITELGMVDSVAVDSLGGASVKVLLTVAGCP
ncbi:MAG: ATP-binding protein involved in chromosome partitioning, partial [Pseudonocardiales bacterium]|nr:ATP-binding protein involved in chromosome partitioning [Pseudonocardiales bacterium]